MMSTYETLTVSMGVLLGIISPVSSIAFWKLREDLKHMGEDIPSVTALCDGGGVIVEDQSSVVACWKQILSFTLARLPCRRKGYSTIASSDWEIIKSKKAYAASWYFFLCVSWIFSAILTICTLLDSPNVTEHQVWCAVFMAVSILGVVGLMFPKHPTRDDRLRLLCTHVRWETLHVLGGFLYFLLFPLLHDIQYIIAVVRNDTSPHYTCNAVFMATGLVSLVFCITWVVMKNRVSYSFSFYLEIAAINVINLLHVVVFMKKMEFLGESC